VTLSCRAFKTVKSRDLAHLGKEVNRLDKRERGEVDVDEAADLLLTYGDPANDRGTNVLLRLGQFPLKQVAAMAGLSERRLRDIHGTCNPK
jgi:hypothetical protein